MKIQIKKKKMNLENIIIYEHILTIEEPNENYNNLDNLIVLLYDGNIRHFSLILTSCKEFKESHTINIEKTADINIEDLTKEKFN